MAQRGRPTNASLGKKDKWNPFAVGEAKPRGRPLKNRSNFWSQHHYGMLVKLAKQVLNQFDWQLDIHELINTGWFAQARYYKDVTGKARRIKREMYNWACKQCPNADRNIDGVNDDDIVLCF